MKGAVVLFLMLSLGNVGINFFPCRESLVSVLGAGDKPKVRAMCAIGILVCSGIITLVYPNIMSIFSLSGGLLCCYIGWVFPFLIMVRTMRKCFWVCKIFSGEEVVSVSKTILLYRIVLYGIHFCRFNGSESVWV
jgi:hypothetical protein